MDRRINIITKVSLMSSHLALPKGRHLDAAVHVMAYVGQKYNFRFYDTTYLVIASLRNMIGQSVTGLPRRLEH